MAAANPGPLTSIANALHPGVKKLTPKSTDMTHHPDGTHSVSTHMSDGTEHPNSGAVADLDGLHDKLHENLSE
jgi:hypothetical protein